ncbi:22272_t:CDS:2, partial [Dentiscutata erythropus]
MLSMKLAKVATLHIIYYELEAKNNSEPQQFLFIEKNPEYAKELLTWIQNAIATKKLHNPVYSISEKCSIGSLYSQNPTSQYLEFLSRAAIRHKIDHFDSGKYYAEDDTSDSNLHLNLEPELKTLASTLKPINENISEIDDIYNLYRDTIAEIGSKLSL